jgi:hypothetical protein
VHLAWQTYIQTGLFMVLGSDYGLYVSQAAVLQQGNPADIYDRFAIDRNYKTLLNAYGHDPSYRPDTSDLWGTHVPYPPLFAWTMQSFVGLSPVWGFVAWTALNLIIVVLVGIRLAQHCPAWDRPTVLLLVLGSYPVAVTLLIGQLQIVLAWALVECFLALQAGKDWKAGLWLGILLLKPHYGILIGPLLIWKQRWRAVLGVAATGAVLLGGSIAAVGWPALMAYPQSFSVMAQFRGDDPYVMINWRSLVLELRPEITDRNGVLVAAVLGSLTVACIALVWRGVWRPSAHAFPFQFALTILATLLVNYHSHPYGAVLVVMPIGLVLMSRLVGKLSQGAALAAAILPTLVLTLGYGHPVTNDEFYVHLLWASRLLKGLLFLLFSCLFFDWMASTRMWANAIVVQPRNLQHKASAWMREQPMFPVSQRVARRSDSRRR